MKIHSDIYLGTKEETSEAARQAFQRIAISNGCRQFNGFCEKSLNGKPYVVAKFEYKNRSTAQLEEPYIQGIARAVRELVK